MSRFAFFAPLKSPLHDVPSGDREFAAGILAALSMNSNRFSVDLVSELRCYDGLGSHAVQRDLLGLAEVEISRLLNDRRSGEWQAWITYHNYYKAPDLIGPAICKALDIPYLIVEASRSKRRLSGPWRDFAQRSEKACDRAEVIFHVTDRDRAALEKHRPDHQKIVHLAPFLNATTLPPYARKSASSQATLLAVGMHREADKLDSYKILAEILPHLVHPQWHLQIVGDGPARKQVRALFSPFKDRVTFLGQLDKTALCQIYESATLFIWPGVNEAFGMVYLEAQAAGLPVVAQNRPGVREVLAPQQLLIDVGSYVPLALAVDSLLSSPAKLAALSGAGQTFVRQNHMLDSASATLSRELDLLLV